MADRYGWSHYSYSGIFEQVPKAISPLAVAAYMP
jgi:hypothetical protein